MFYWRLPFEIYTCLWYLCAWRVYVNSDKITSLLPLPPSLLLRVKSDTAINKQNWLHLFPYNTTYFNCTLTTLKSILSIFRFDDTSKQYRPYSAGLQGMKWKLVPQIIQCNESRYRGVVRLVWFCWAGPVLVLETDQPSKSRVRWHCPGVCVAEKTCFS